jgi:hypothetical protein
MTHSLRVAGVVALAALMTFASSASALTWTCEGIARKGFPDPAGASFAGKFGGGRHGGPAINGAGDVTFFATPRGGPRRLYFYPNVGAPSILAEQDGAAPGGGSFTQFRRPSINAAGDVAFFGDLASGEGIFVKPAAGAMFQVVRAGDPAPGGGTFDGFDGVARINAAGDVAFLARVTGGPSGVFLYDAGTVAISSVARVGDVALDGREICEFIAPAVGLGATVTAFHVGTKVSCADALEPELIGIYYSNGLGIRRVALEGDATPTPTTTYAKFYGDPDANEVDQILFRVTVVGTSHFTGLFRFDPVGPTTTTVVGSGDAAPGGGSLRSITEPHLKNGGRAGFRANVKGEAHEGIFLFDGVDEAVVRRPDAVPADIFIPGSTYKKIFEEIGVDRAGTWVTYSATVHEPASGSKLGLFRCNGS